MHNLSDRVPFHLGQVKNVKVYAWYAIGLSVYWFLIFCLLYECYLLYPATLKSAGYYVIPSIQKIAF